MLTKQIHCIKTANKQDQFKQKQSFKREKEHVQSFTLACLKFLTAEKLGIPEFLDSGRKSWTLDSGH